MGRLRDAIEAFEKAMRRFKSAVLKARDERGSELYEFLETVQFKGLSLPMSFFRSV